MRRNAAMLIGLMACFGHGCQSAWETSFEPSTSAVFATLPADEPVQVRRVPWERLDATLVELEHDLIESDTHVSEWDAGALGRRKAELLRGLQISADPDRTEVLGRSVFRSTSPIDPRDGELERFAREIGATRVVWSSRYEGKTAVIEREPVTTTGWVWDGSRDRYGRGGNFGYTDTTYIPVVIEADEYAWVAYFLRTQ